MFCIFSLFVQSKMAWLTPRMVHQNTALLLIYFGGANVYYDKLRESVDSGFPELEFERLA